MHHLIFAKKTKTTGLFLPLFGANLRQIPDIRLILTQAIGLIEN